MRPPRSIYMNEFDKKSLADRGEAQAEPGGGGQGPAAKKPGAPAGKRVIDASAVEVRASRKTSAGDDAPEPSAAAQDADPRRAPRRRAPDTVRYSLPHPLVRDRVEVRVTAVIATGHDPCPVA
jgi:hypothetical protein